MITPGKNSDDGNNADRTPKAGTNLKTGDQTPPAPPDMEDCGLSAADMNDLYDAKRALNFLDRVRKTIKHNSSSDTSVNRVLQKQSTCKIEGVAKREAPPAPEQELEKLGRFNIIELIGQGGFAKVFRAHDPVLKRDVALKVPKPHALMSDESALRFKREAEAAAILSHPSIVPVFETGTFGPVAYIASEFFPGQTLEGWVAEHRNEVDFKTSVKIVAELADALHHAHQRRILHRDLKPANILVVSGSKKIEKRLRVTDFGLAKQIDEVESNLTIQGAVVGTPAYMSPEQARAEDSLAATSDIYSLGVILYELLTGKLPCIGKNHLATIKLIEQGEFEAPRSLNSRIPRDLESICLKCLAHRCSDRYQNGFELNSDLNAWLEGRPVSARRISMPTRFFRWTQSNPMLSSALTFAFSCLAVGLALTAWKWNESNKNLKESVAHNERADRHLLLAQTAIDEVIGQVTHELQDSPEFSDLRTEVVAKVVELQEKLLTDEPDDDSVRLETGQAYLDLATLELELGKFTQAHKSLDRFETVVATDIPRTGDALETASLMQIKSSILRAVIFRNNFQIEFATKILDELIDDLKFGFGEIDEENRNQQLLACLLEKSVIIDKPEVADCVDEALELIERSGLDDWDSRIVEAELLFQRGYAEVSLDSSCYNEAFEPVLEKVQAMLLSEEESVDTLFLLARTKSLKGFFARKEKEHDIAIRLLTEGVEIVTRLKDKFPNHSGYADRYFKFNTFLIQALIQGGQEEKVIPIRKGIAKEYSELNPDLILAKRTVASTSLALVRLALDVARLGEDPEIYAKAGLQLFETLDNEALKQPSTKRLQFICHESYSMALELVGKHAESLEYALIAEAKLYVMLQRNSNLIRELRVGQFYRLYCRQLIRAHRFDELEGAVERMMELILRMRIESDRSWNVRIANYEAARTYSNMMHQLSELEDVGITEEFVEIMHDRWLDKAVGHLEESAKANLAWTQTQIILDLESGVLGPVIADFAQSIIDQVD